MTERRPPEDSESSAPDAEAADRSDSATLTRRNLLRWGALAGAAAPFAALPETARAAGIGEAAVALEEATIAQLQAAMTAGGLNSLGLVNMYIERIAGLDENGPTLNSVLEVNPDARRIARQLDRERRDGHVRGPLHGIPILLKANIDTADRMSTTAGSLALIGDPPHQDATVAARLRV